jgi:hypothetical protein
MNKGNLFAALGAVALLGGAGVLLSEKGELAGDTDGGVTEAATMVVRTPSKAQMANKTVEDKDTGKPVRVVGVSDAEYVADADPVDSAVGPAIKVKVQPSHVCNVVFHEKVKTTTSTETLHGKTITTTTTAPDTKAFSWGTASEPVSLGCVAGDCIWNVLLTGDDCVKASKHPGYLGSTLKELKGLADASMKARVLRVEGTCTDPKTGKSLPCTVPYGDSHAKENARPFFAHSWSGRDDANLGADDEKRQDLSSYGKAPTVETVTLTPDAGMKD